MCLLSDCSVWSECIHGMLRSVCGLKHMKCFSNDLFSRSVTGQPSFVILVVCWLIVSAKLHSDSQHTKNKQLAISLQSISCCAWTFGQFDLKVASQGVRSTLALVLSVCLSRSHFHFIPPQFIQPPNPCFFFLLENIAIELVLNGRPQIQPFINNVSSL